MRTSSQQGLCAGARSLSLSPRFVSGPQPQLGPFSIFAEPELHRSFCFSFALWLSDAYVISWYNQSELILLLVSPYFLILICRNVFLFQLYGFITLTVDVLTDVLLEYILFVHCGIMVSLYYTEGYKIIQLSNAFLTVVTKEICRILLQYLWSSFFKNNLCENCWLTLFLRT